MKLTHKDKIEIYGARKEGKTLSSLSMKYNIDLSNLKYLLRLIERHGFYILKNDYKVYYTKEFKRSCINRVLLKHESSMSVSIDEGFKSKAMLRNWIREYKENGYNVV